MEIRIVVPAHLPGQRMAAQSSSTGVGENVLAGQGLKPDPN